MISAKVDEVLSRASSTLCDWVNPYGVEVETCVDETGAIFVTLLKDQEEPIRVTGRYTTIEVLQCLNEGSTVNQVAEHILEAVLEDAENKRAEGFILEREMDLDAEI